jgi:acetyl-CoA carboxylase biotin carboxyl carrier protein
MTDAEAGRWVENETLRAVWDEARELVRRLEGSSVQRLTVVAGSTRIEIERDAAAVSASGAAVLAAAHATHDGAAAADADARHAITAPLVGTFYRAPQPGADPFVKEGDVVDASQTVAIVEAMKLMNQVPAGVAGTIAEIVVEDGQWVEFEQVLMYVEPAES